MRRGIHVRISRYALHYVCRNHRLCKPLAPQLLAANFQACIVEVKSAAAAPIIDGDYIVRGTLDGRVTYLCRLFVEVELKRGVRCSCLPIKVSFKILRGLVGEEIARFTRINHA